jgi:hypothetical protein
MRYIVLCLAALLGAAGACVPSETNFCIESSEATVLTINGELVASLELTEGIKYTFVAVDGNEVICLPVCTFLSACPLYMAYVLVLSCSACSPT